MHAAHRPTPWRPIAWSAAVALLAVPWIAGAPWSPLDYWFAALMIAFTGGAVELGLRAATGAAYRAGAIVAIAAAFLLVWVNAAVGLFGSEENDANAMFGVVLLVAIGSTLLARLRAGGVARAMRAAAATQVTVGVISGGTGWASPADAVIVTALFGALWGIAATLFARAARQSVAQSRTASPSI